MSPMDEWHRIGFPEEIGRDDRIRTCDLLDPNEARYQTALHPDYWEDLLICQGNLQAKK